MIIIIIIILRRRRQSYQLFQNLPDPPDLPELNLGMEIDRYKFIDIHLLPLSRHSLRVSRQLSRE